MIPQTLERRIAMQFDRLDSDRSGYIELADYDRMVDELVRAVGEKPDSPAAQKVRSEYHKLFERLAQQFDTDRDGRINREEYFDGIESAYDSEGGYDALRPAVTAVFKMVDRNSDGKVGLQEFRTVAKVHGVPESEYESTFRKYDADGDSSLSLDEMHTFIDEYYNKN